MRNRSQATKACVGVSLLFFAFLLLGLVLPPALRAEEGDELPPLPFTLLYSGESDDRIEGPSQPMQAPGAGPLLPAQVTVFYPTSGQSTGGLCWMGLMIDRYDNVYPIGSGQVSKILPNGRLVNGGADENFFATGGFSDWATLDEEAGKIYTAGDAVRVAPFVEGSTFSNLIAVPGSGTAIALGRGALAGSLIISSPANQVIRVNLVPLGASVFAGGDTFFRLPEAIASASDGTLYVVSNGITPSQLTKITPAGIPSHFAIGTDPQTNRTVIVDYAGNVYWSHAAGIDKYNAQGDLLGTLPGPPDKPFYENPMGAAFDSKGNLYVVDNFGCKQIYKYTFSTTHLANFKVLVEIGSVTLSWQTAQEANLTGFHLYRADRDTTFTRVTDTPIPAQGATESGASYQYVDKPGNGHYVYQLVSVDASGQETPRAQAETEVEAAARHLFIPMLQR